MEELTRFGGGSRTGTGHLVWDQRVGPCVVVLSRSLETERVLEFARRLNADMLFTVLIPDLTSMSPQRAEQTLIEAVGHMRMNWHPRVGLVSFGALGASTAALAESGLEAVVDYGSDPTELAAFTAPVLAHQARVVTTSLPESIEVVSGSGGWLEHGPGTDDSYGATLDFLRYHLS